MEGENTQEQSAAAVARERHSNACSNPADDMLHTTQNEMSLLQGIRYDKAIRFKATLSICVCLAYGILGWTKGQQGPAFLDILVISKTDIEKGSAFMTSYYIGRMVGPIMGGLLYSKINKYLIFVISMTLCSLMTAFIPLCTGYEQMLIAHAMYGISGGILVVAVVSEAVGIWGKTGRGRSYLQVLNTASAIFSVLSPLATAPFLLNTSEKETKHKHFSDVTIDNFDFKPMTVNLSLNFSGVKSFENISDSVIISEPTSRLYIIYTVSATLVLILAIPFCILYFRSRSKKSSVRLREHVSYKFLGDHSILAKRLQLVNVGIFSFVFFDLEFTFTAYLSAFCVLGLNWSNISGAYLTSVVFFASMFGRISGIILVQFVKVRTILLFSSLIYTAGYIAILISAHAQVDFGIWVSICIIGAPFGLAWPTFISWVNENLVPAYGKVHAFFNTVGFFGCVVNPLLLGYLMEELSPFWFCYLSAGKSVISVINILLMFIYSSSPNQLKNTEITENQDDDRLE